jgi:hypothetical protein
LVRGRPFLQNEAGRGRFERRESTAGTPASWHSSYVNLSTAGRELHAGFVSKGPKPVLFDVRPWVDETITLAESAAMSYIIRKSSDFVE